MTRGRHLFLLGCLGAALAACAAPPKGTVRVRHAPVESPPPGRGPEPAENAAPVPAAPPAPSKPTAPTPAAKPITHPNSIVQTASTYLGTPYRYGGSDRKGMDCSGLVYRVFQEHRVRLPRTSRQQFGVGKRVDRQSLRAGDLVFFASPQGRVNHVGIYVGDDKFIHASTGKKQVRVDSLTSRYFTKHWAGARRLKTQSAR